ncbi:MAG: hypothetical protein C0502_06790 [Opitutus sp.]|nr:hypothetical protein [Opitutus sp.]
MKSPTPLRLFLGAILLAAGSGLSLAHEDKPHAKESPADAPAAWRAVGEAADQIGAKVNSGDINGVHDLAEAMAANLQVVAEKSALGAEQKKRLEAAVRQAGALAGSVHEAADANDLKKTEAEFKKLGAALKLVRALLPAESQADGHPAAANAGSGADEQAVRAVLTAYKAGLEKLDVGGLTGLFTADSQIFESGGVEGTFAHYLEHHIGPELAEFTEFSFRDHKIEVRLDGPFAFATESYIYRIVLKSDGRVIEKRGVATSVLKKTSEGWKIHISHSSSRNLPKTG